MEKWGKTGKRMKGRLQNHWFKDECWARRRKAADVVMKMMYCF